MKTQASPRYPKLVSGWYALFVSFISPREIMLYYAIVFFVIALIAGLFGFTGLAGGAASIAQILFFVFIVLFVLSLIFGRKPRA